MSAELRTFVFSAMFVFPLCGSAQRMDSVVLREVVVEESRLGSYAISKFTLKVDSTTRQLASASSLADLLRKFGYGHVRGYGPGGLASASFRGTGSSHTAVLWNGINLISPLSGQLDLSLVPASFIDDASIQTGGTASLYGNGSIGATINLNNRAQFNKGLTLNTFSSAGSFGSYYQDMGVSWSGKKFITSTKVFFNQSENNFEFFNKTSSPPGKEERDHTATHQNGFLQQNYWQVSPQNIVTLKLWYQDNTYQVPNPTSIPRKAEAIEQNSFYRLVGGWHYTHRLFDVNFQSAFVRHDLAYTDPYISVDSKSTFNTSINNLEGNYSIAKNVTMTSGVNYTWEQGLVDEFGADTPKRNRVALFNALRWIPTAQWEIALAVREELVNQNTTPVAPSLTIKRKARTGIEFYTSVSRNYRIPTFNDLYWKGAGGLGNADLNSELSMSSEAGIGYTSPLKTSNSSLSFKASVFNNNVKDWILWTPLTASTWSPQNVKRVWSRGVETQASASIKRGSLIVEFSLLYTFTKSTNTDIYENSNSNELNKQLMLTPMHEGSATCRLLWKSYGANLVSSYTGKQYTDGDNNEYYALKAYSTTNLWLNKSITGRIIKAKLIGEVNNIFNASYQSRPGYPMPGRNYKLGVSIFFNKPNKI